jgi:hypothetical protein
MENLKTERRVWRLHLSTAVMAVLISALFVGVNLRGQNYESTPEMVAFTARGWPVRVDISVDDAAWQKLDLQQEELYAARETPNLDADKSLKEMGELVARGKEIDRQEGRYLAANALSQEIKARLAWRVALNAFVAVAIMASAALLNEYRIAKRERPRG